MEKDRFKKKSQLLLNSQLKKVFIHKGSIELEVLNLKSKRTRQFKSSLVVLTMPLGVLQKSILFEPPLPMLEKILSTLHMGHVQRITFEFKERFWEKLSDKPIGFLHSNKDHYFPAWWTQMPRRTPYLTAWQGAPKPMRWPLGRRKNVSRPH